MDYLTILKIKLGLSSTGVDEYLTEIIEGTKMELQNKGIDLDNKDSQMLVIDICTCKYKEIEVPKGIKYRQACLINKYSFYKGKKH